MDVNELAKIAGRKIAMNRNSRSFDQVSWPHGSTQVKQD
jgi:hypothetical protein